MPIAEEVNTGARSRQRPPQTDSDFVPGDTLLKSSQVEAEFGIPMATLATWRTRGGGPPFFRPKNRTVLYRRSSVVAWLGSEVRSTGAATATSTTTI